MAFKNKYLEILTKDFLEEEHFVKNKSLTTIAKEIGCDWCTVRYYMEFNKIKWVKSNTHGQKLNKHARWSGYEEIPKTHFNNIKNSAKLRNLEFAITIEFIWDLYLKQDRKCALSGRPIYFIACKKATASLDRINPNFGYLENNVQWLHKDINYAKQSLNNEEFIDMCKEIINYVSTM